MRREQQDRAEIFLDTLRPEWPDYIVALEQEALQEEVPIIRRGTRDVIRFLLQSVKPVKMLEIGTGVGYSALVMKEVMPENGSILTVENYAPRIQKAKAHFEKYHARPFVTLWDMDGEEALKKCIREGMTFDGIFLDGPKGQYGTYLPLMKNVLNRNGFILCDNLFHEGDVLESRFIVRRRDRTIHKHMRQFLKDLREDPELLSIALVEGDGLSLSFYRGKSDR